jgi:hypothetical protein
VVLVGAMGAAAGMAALAVPASAESASASAAPLRPVSVQVRNGTEQATAAELGYQVAVRSNAVASMAVTVTEQLPTGAQVLAVGAGGTVTGESVSWQMQLAPGAVLSLPAIVQVPAAEHRVSSVCVSAQGTTQLLNCATDSDVLINGGRSVRPWFLALKVLIGVPVALIALVALVWFVRRVIRRGPPLWLVLGGAIGLVAAVAVPMVAVAGTAMNHATEVHESTMGWAGPGQTTRLGQPTVDGGVEFTGYQVTCSRPPASGTCLATVSALNRSEDAQQWFGVQQRAYLSNGTWVRLDSAATTAANGGVDPFAQGLAPNSEVFAVFAFNVPEGAQLTALDLREGVFSRGIAVLTS